MYEAWNRHDLAAAGRDFDEHVVYDPSDLAILGIERVFYGLEDLARFWADWLPQWSDIQCEVRWIASTGDRVVAWITQTNTGRGSGAAVEMVTHGTRSGATGR